LNFIRTIKNAYGHLEKLAFSDFFDKITVSAAENNLEEK